MTNQKFEEVALTHEQAVSKETKAKYTKLPALVLAGDNMIYETTNIARFLARNTPLYKSENETNMALIDSWMGLFKEETEKLCAEVIMPVLGHKPYTNRSYNEALACFKSFLPKLKNMGDYLVGSSLTIADLYAAAMLHFPFALLIDEGQRKAFPKFADWYKKVASDPAFVEVFGIPRFCKTAMKPLLPPQEEHKPEAKAEKKAEKKPEKKAEKKEKKAEAGEEEEEEAPKKKLNPLDQLPPSPFDLDSFKREFLANKTAETRRKYIQEKFWNKFDPNGWGLWYLDYMKAEGECEVLYKTANLLGGFIWRIENMGRYGFGIHGIFGEEPKLELRGAYMWRGTEVPFFMKEHPSFEFYKTRKLDPNSPEDRKLLEDFWCADEDEKILGERYREGKYFR